MGAEVVAVEALVKRFGKVTALDGVDLRLERGQVHGYLGPNGAGKSTTIRILLGLLRADAGTARIWGADPWQDAVALHRRIAYVPGDVSLWPNLTGGEAIDLFARLRGGFDRKRRDELVDRFGLDPSKKAGAYSKGNRQKVAIISALASNVELLVLDEPSAGLDPLMESVFAECIEQERSLGTTVLLSSHTLAQVERLCDTISIIRAGRIVETGTLQELRHLTRTSVRARTRRDVTRAIAAHPGVHGTDGALDTPESELSCDVDTDALDEVVGLLHRAGLISLVCQPPSLEELFLRHYSEDAHTTAVHTGEGRGA